MRAWLSLGANIGNPHAQLADAVRRIDDTENVSVTKRSSVISTKPWGKTDQPDFANMALEIETTLTPHQLLSALQAIETALGRVRQEVWGPRLIDIDIIAYDKLLMITTDLILPHAHAHERDFVLVPLREIAPDAADWVEAMASGRI